MKAKIKYLLGASMIFLLAGCGTNMEGGKPSNYEPYEAGSRGESSYGDYYEPKTDSPKNGDSTSSSDTENKDNSQVNLPRAGQVTCSTYDDNSNFTYWQELISYQSRYHSGTFYDYYSKYAFRTENRLELNIINGNNVKVTLKNTQIQAYADNFHKAYLFPKQKQNSYEVEISYTDSNNQTQNIEKEVRDGDIIDLEQTFTTSSNLQLMFVVDATGSMGDEIKYLQAEIDDVITKVKDANQSANIELSIMMYRDKNDDYLIRYSDFTSDIESQKSFLANQEARGGGDFEEAVEEALEAAMDKQWNPNATKLLFHVADAPAHDKDVPTWNDTVLNAAAKGIKIFSIASSGINKKTEYFFRSQSLITGGQYIFLTDDSRIGGSHEVAETEHPLTVEYLNSCLVRLINGYFKGVMTNPVPYYQDR